jgi:DNA polymerase-3 subunit beta
VSLLSSERSRAVRLGLSRGQLELQANAPDLGEARESLPIEYAGGEVEIGFNAQYLLDFLAVAGTDSIELQLKDAESQGLLCPSGGTGIEHRYVVMPMRY